MIRVTNGFNKLSQAEFSQNLASIVACMTNNTAFASLQTAVTALSTEADVYDALAIKAMSRSKDAIIARDASRVKVTAMLHSIGFSVSSIANGDLEILSSSGYQYTQPAKPTPNMQRPATPKLRSGVNSGEIVCKTATQSGMKSVKYYITTDAAALAATSSAAWNVESSNKIKYTFSNLIPGQRYYIKVGMVGVREQEVTSEAVSYIAQ
jgi:hypothetical protein